MPVRKIGHCRACSHWRDAASNTLAGSMAEQGECRRRVQTDTDGLRSRQPVTQSHTACSEYLSQPAPARLAPNCGHCRYWILFDAKQDPTRDYGVCRVWAPRWSSTEAGHAFPITRRESYCGDGRSVSYVDPDEEEDI